MVAGNAATAGNVERMSRRERGARIGIVPSVEVMPLVGWSHGGNLSLKSCAGYGRVIRGLLTGTLDAGVVPFEMLVTDLFLQPGQATRWKIPAVLQPGPVELVLRSGISKQLRPPARRKLAPASLRLKFAVESRSSLTGLGLIEWQRGLRAPHLAAPSLVTLPMHLMLRGLAAGEIDGMLAPSPWGLQAEAEGIGRLEADFRMGRFEQKLVFVCRSNLVERKAPAMARLAEEIAERTPQFRQQAAFERIAREISALGAPRVDPGLYWESILRHPQEPQMPEFRPDHAWFEAELTHLAELHGGGWRPEQLLKLAQQLVVPS